MAGFIQEFKLNGMNRILEIFKRYRTFQIIVPLFIFFVGFLLTVYYLATFPVVASPTEWDFTRKVALLILSIFVILVSQKLIDDRPSYILMMLGFTIFFYSQLENVLDMYINIQYFFSPLDLEDFTSVGLILAAFGLMRWAQVLIDSKELVQQHQRETELYASLLRHDLGNDLQALLGYVEAALLLGEKDAARVTEMIESAQTAGLRMSRLVKAFSRSGSGNQTEMYDLVYNIVNESTITHRGLNIELISPKQIGIPRAYGSSLLAAVFENLIRNTYQHAGENSHVVIEVSRTEDVCVVIYSDDGPGISDDIKDRIFQRGISDSEKGLGLYLCKTIMDICGGSIELLQTDSRSGARFQITVPLI